MANPHEEVRMAAFTDAELEYLAGQRLARLATSSAAGQADVSPVGFSVDGDTVVSGGIDITKTVRYRHLLENPRAAIVIDDLASVDPWRPRGVKVRGEATIEDDGGRPRIRIQPAVVWSWGINAGAPARFAGIERRVVG
jgi:pyridoxamine 5'-phosphate oxidase family protein